MTTDLPIPKNHSQRMYKFGFEEGRKQALEDVKKLIDEIERKCWDCNLPCGVVNSDADKCKICGVGKETSWDNDKLEELKQQINKLEKTAD